MLLKGLITSAVIGISIPLFAVGVISGMILAKAKPRQPGCGRCCVVCNGHCKFGSNNDQGNRDSDTPSQSYQI